MNTKLNEGFAYRNAQQAFANMLRTYLTTPKAEFRWFLYNQMQGLLDRYPNCGVLPTKPSDNPF